jgi:hypothetical protein
MPPSFRTMDGDACLNISPSKPVSPAEYFLGALDELNELCNTVGEMCFRDDDSGARVADVRLLAEYRHLLKLRFDIFKRMAALIEEAHFQRAVLYAMEAVDRDLHDRVVEALRELEDEWRDDTEDDIPLHAESGDGDGAPGDGE